MHNSLEWRSLPIDAVKSYPRQTRVHSKRQIEKLKKLLRHFGQVVPIVVDADNVIVDGHAVWQAMRELDAGEIAVVAVNGRTDSDVKALRIALNRLPADAAWDDERLRAELEELVTLSFDLELTGFDAVEIDHLLEVDVPKTNVVEDDALPPLQQLAVSAVGEVWNCGRHRIGCGDALDAAFVGKLCGDMRAKMCFIDPPYNVPIDGFVSGKGRVQHREFVQGIGEMSSVTFAAFLAQALSTLRGASTDGALVYACIDWRHVYELLGAGRECRLDLINLCVWAKTNAGMGSLYRSQHELVCVFKAGSGQHANNVELGRHGRNRSNLWTYRGLNAFGGDRDDLLSAHPTVKPTLLIADAIRDVTKRGDIVLDTFLGSGSTLIAAEETGRIGIGADLDPLYVDVAIRRWQARTRRDAVHAETGEIFDDRAQRTASQLVERTDG